MRKRKLSKRKSKSNYRRGTKVNRKNSRPASMRGGWRL